MPTGNEILPQDSVWHDLALLVADSDQVAAELEKSLAEDAEVWRAVANLIDEESREEEARREQAHKRPTRPQGRFRRAGA